MGSHTSLLMKKRKTKKREATEEEMRLKKEENIRKRKQQMERLQEEKKTMTINKILNLKKVKKVSKMSEEDTKQVITKNPWNYLTLGMDKKFLSSKKGNFILFKKDAITSKNQEYFPDRRIKPEVYMVYKNK